MQPGFDLTQSKQKMLLRNFVTHNLFKMWHYPQTRGILSLNRKFSSVFIIQERRIKAVQELYRILKIGGSGLIYAWARDQEVSEKPSTYLQTDKPEMATPEEEFTTTDVNVRLPVHENRTNFKHNDLLVPWKNKSDEATFHRFYHVFDEGELESLMYEALGKDKMEIETLFYDQGNWCVIFTKKK